MGKKISCSECKLCFIRPLRAQSPGVFSVMERLSREKHPNSSVSVIMLYMEVCEQSADSLRNDTESQREIKL